MFLERSVFPTYAWQKRNELKGCKRVRFFPGMTESSFFDPPLTLVLPKSQDGLPCFENVNWRHAENVVQTLTQLSGGDRESEVKLLLEELKGHPTHEMVIVFMLFAALAAREDDLVSKEAPSPGIVR